MNTRIRIQIGFGKRQKSKSGPDRDVRSDRAIKTSEIGFENRNHTPINMRSRIGL